MRRTLIVLCLAWCSATTAQAQVSVSIGINFPVYPELVPVPGYPVYYAPQARSNYFFYDGMYWVYQRDNWYASSWYNGPWWAVDPEAVPLFILRVPVRYYRQPPTYFRGWRPDAPPRWGDHWGRDWDQRHRGWGNWDRRAVPPPAPLPTFQRQYSGNRYPPAEQQQALQSRNYRYEPREPVVQQRYQAQRAQVPPAAHPAPREQAVEPRQRATPPPDRPNPHARVEPPRQPPDQANGPGREAVVPAAPDRSNARPREEPPQQRPHQEKDSRTGTGPPPAVREQPPAVREQPNVRPPDQGSRQPPGHSKGRGKDEENEDDRKRK